MKRINALCSFQIIVWIIWLLISIYDDFEKLKLVNIGVIIGISSVWITYFLYEQLDIGDDK